MILSDATCIQAMESAVINRRAAFQVELAVGLGVFLRHGGASIEAKRELTAIYASVGYDCLNARGLDYKTVNRRINVTAALFDHVNVKKWVGRLDEHDALRAVYLALEPYEFHTVSDVVRFALPKPERRESPLLTVTPDHSVLMPVPSNHSGQDSVMGMFRRRANDRPDAVLVKTEHLALAIPALETSSEEIRELAMKLLELARDKDAIPA